MTVLDGMKLSVVVSVLAQIYLLFVYFSAIRKKSHSSFTILIFATFLSIVSLVMTSISYFIEMSETLATDVYRYGLFIIFPAAILGVVGVRSLVKAYVSSAPEVPPEPPQSSGKWGE